MSCFATAFKSSSGSRGAGTRSVLLASDPAQGNLAEKWWAILSNEDVCSEHAAMSMRLDSENASVLAGDMQGSLVVPGTALTTGRSFFLPNGDLRCRQLASP